MKAIRVTNKYHFNHLVPSMEVGTEVTIVEQIKNPENGELHYIVAEVPELPSGDRYAYDAKGFATLPSTTEEVTIEQQQEAIIYQR